MSRFYHVQGFSVMQKRKKRKKKRINWKDFDA